MTLVRGLVTVLSVIPTVTGIRPSYVNKLRKRISKIDGDNELNVKFINIKELS